MDYFVALFLMCFINGVLTQDLKTLNISEEINKIDVAGKIEFFDKKIVSKIKEECRAKHGESAVETVEAAKKTATQCILQYIKPNKLSAEVRKSVKRGSLNALFRKYCGYSEELRGCVRVFYTAAEACVGDTQLEVYRRSGEVLERVVERLMEFVCYEDGVRVVMFSGEQGVECLEEHKPEIRHCLRSNYDQFREENPDLPGLNESLSLAGINQSISGIDQSQNLLDGNLTKEDLTEGGKAVNATIEDMLNRSDILANVFDSLSSLGNYSLFGESQCRLVLRTRRCVIGLLETCEDPTPANLIDSLLAYMLKATPCHKVSLPPAASSDPTSGAASARPALGRLWLDAGAAATRYVSTVWCWLDASCLTTGYEALLSVWDTSFMGTLLLSGLIAAHILF